MTEIKLAVVGEHSIFKTALVRLLEEKGKFRVACQAPAMNEILKMSETDQPDVILIIFPENMKCTGLVPPLVDLLKKIPVLVLTDSDDKQLHDKCLRAGISGLVLNKNGINTLSKALEKVYQGEFWFERTLMRETISRLSDEQRRFENNLQNTPYGNFTERERQVIKLICQGFKNKAIADKLFIAETTVRHHLSSIFEKLNITSRLELVVYVFEHNLITKDES